MYYLQSLVKVLSSPQLSPPNFCLDLHPFTPFYNSKFTDILLKLRSPQGRPRAKGRSGTFDLEGRNRSEFLASFFHLIILQGHVVTGWDESLRKTRRNPV